MKILTQISSSTFWQSVVKFFFVPLSLLRADISRIYSIISIFFYLFLAHNKKVSRNIYGVIDFLRNDPYALLSKISFV